MEYRTLGKTGLRVSSIGFGCGAVGGILVKGSRAEMTRAVARAIELGINYFDTAAIYGDGESETNLGTVLQEVARGTTNEVIVGTKVRVQATEFDAIEQAVTRSVEQSLKRLRLEQIDLIQLHNFIAHERLAQRQWLNTDDVALIIHVFGKLRDQGKVRFWGINGLGEPRAVQDAVTGDVHTAQVCFNLLNPSAGLATPDGFPFDDYGQLIELAAAREVGVIAIRVLAGGALSGSAQRHANATQQVDPIASGASFAEDVDLAQHFNFLVDEGYASTLIEAAIRFALGNPGVATAAIGISTLAQLEEAVAAANRGPLPPAALARLQTVWAGFGANT